VTVVGERARRKAGREGAASGGCGEASRPRWWQHPRLALAIIVAVGALLRIYRCDALSLWLDEGITVHVSRQPWVTVLGFHGAYETHPPLYFILVKVTALLVPELHAGRVVSIVAGTVTIPVVYSLAARVLGTRPALVAGAVLAISPLHIWYSQEARMYALGALLVTMSYLALVGFYWSPRRAWAILYGLAVLSAMYANYGAAYALVPQVILLGAVTRKHRWHSLPLWGAGVVATVGFLPWLPQLLQTTTTLGMNRQSYLGVSLEKIWASIVSIAGVGGYGSYFWGAPTPWDQWPRAQPILVLDLALAIVAGGVSLARRPPLSLAVAVGLFPGMIAVAAALSLVSPGYADRTVLVGVIGWALVLGALPFGRMPGWLKVAGGAGAILTVLVSLLTLRVVYDGADKQHWAELASRAALAARFGEPVWVYGTYAATLIDVYQPSVLGLSGAGSPDTIVRTRAIGDGGSAPAFDAEAVWLAYMEMPGVERLRRHLADQGYERFMHRYHWHPLYLDLYVRAGVRLGREIPINGRFEPHRSSVGEWRLSGVEASFSPSDTGGRTLHLTGGTPEGGAVASAPALGERLYLVDFDARRESPAGRFRAFLICASATARLEVAPDGEGISAPNDGRWHRVSMAAICPRGAQRVFVDIRNAGPGELMVRDVVLREVAPADGRGTPR